MAKKKPVGATGRPAKKTSAKANANGKGAKPKKKPGKPRQSYIKGTEPVRIKEIDDIADRYRDVRDERMGLSEQESDLQAELLDALKKHKLTSYRMDDSEVYIEAGKVKAKVRKVKEKAESGATDEI